MPPFGPKLYLVKLHHRKLGANTQNWRQGQESPGDHVLILHLIG